MSYIAQPYHANLDATVTSGALLTRYTDIADFPGVGSTRTLYLVTTTGYLYYWAADSESYIQIAGGTTSGVITYLRPGSTDTYFRPGSTDRYVRPKTQVITYLRPGSTDTYFRPGSTDRYVRP